MRAILKDNLSTVTFIWGEGSIIPQGHVAVQVQHRYYTETSETYTIPDARKYWAQLIQKRFKIHDLLLL